MGLGHRRARPRARAALGDRARGRPGARASARTRSRSRPGSGRASRRSASSGSARTTSGSRARSARAGSARRSSTTAASSTRAATRTAGRGTATGSWRSTTSSSWRTTCSRATCSSTCRRRTSTRGTALERTACVLQDVSSVFDTDGFRQIMDWIERESGVRVRRQRGLAARAPRARRPRPRRELPDRGGHRAVERGARLHLPPPASPRDPPGEPHRPPRLAPAARASSSSQMGEAYPQLAEHADEIERVWRGEEERFSETLARGRGCSTSSPARTAIDAEDAFTLAATYGFPIELTQELAEERGQPVDIDGFRELMEEHRVVSRAGGDESDTAGGGEFASGGPASESEFVGYAKLDVLTAGGRGRGPRGRDVLVQAARVAVLRRERGPGDGQRRARRRASRRRSRSADGSSSATTRRSSSTRRPRAARGGRRASRPS